MIEFGNLAVASDPTEDLLATFRQEARALMDEFIDKLAPHLMGKPMNLSEISDLFQEKRTELLGKLMEGFIKSQHSDLCSEEFSSCPGCGRQLKAEKSPRGGYLQWNRQVGSTLLLLWGVQIRLFSTG